MVGKTKFRDMKNCSQVLKKQSQGSKKNHGFGYKYIRDLENVDGFGFFHLV